jgi:hypothetical protein
MKYRTTQRCHRSCLVANVEQPDISITRSVWVQFHGPAYYMGAAERKVFHPLMRTSTTCEWKTAALENPSNSTKTRLGKIIVSLLTYLWSHWLAANTSNSGESGFSICTCGLLFLVGTADSLLSSSQVPIVVSEPATTFHRQTYYRCAYLLPPNG